MARIETAETAPWTTELRPTSGWRPIDFRELWAYRELLLIFLWRDLRVRYRQTLLGAIWVIGQPLITMIFFTLFFNRVAGIRAPGGLPYSVFILAALLPWNFFSTGVQNSGNSLIGASHLISKIYFPRLLIPASSVMTTLVDLGVAALLLVPLMVYHSVRPGWAILLLPVVLAVAFAMSMGAGLWLSAFNVEYRDVRVIIPFALQLWMYATPVVYPLEVIPERWRGLVLLNPATGIVEAFRAALLGRPWPAGAFGWSAGAAVALLVSGAFYFRRTERRFADVI